MKLKTQKEATIKFKIVSAQPSKVCGYAAYTNFKVHMINAYCDSLCEPNPGEMHVGCWAKKVSGNEALFVKHRKIGHGTCNEAEYHALFTVVACLAEHFGDKPWPEVVIHSDSQLMTKQVNGLWKVTNSVMIALFNKSKQLQEKYGFKLQWIPRENNAVADALAQEQRLKGSGRRYLLEDGRHRVRPNTPCVEIFTDREMSKMLFSRELHELRDMLEGELDTPRPDYTKVYKSLRNMQSEVLKLKKRIPKTNNLVEGWMNSTFGLLNDTFDQFLIMARTEDDLLKENFNEFFSALQKDSGLQEVVQEENEFEFNGIFDDNRH